MSITESLIKIRKFRYSSVWTADGKIMYKDEADTKAKVYFNWYSGKQGLCYGKPGFWFLILMVSVYFYWRFFTKHFKTVSYFVLLILFIGILPLIKIILIKNQFVHFIFLNISILLCLQIANLDCNKIVTSISQLYHLHVVHFIIWHHLFLEFWLVNTWFFAH